MKLLKVSQFLTWPISYAYFHLFYNLKINDWDNLNQVRRPFIVVVNHFSFADSFLFRLILGFNTPHLPLRFMAVNRFDWKWLNFLAEIGVISFIYSLFGVFIVVPGQGLKKNLEAPKRLIREGENIVIYPEGKIVVDHAIAPFKPGAAVLAAETGAPVVPVSLHLGERMFLRKRLTVNIGKPIRVLPDAVTEDTTKIFFDTISGMCCKA